MTCDSNEACPPGQRCDLSLSTCVSAPAAGGGSAGLSGVSGGTSSGGMNTSGGSAGAAPLGGAAGEGPGGGSGGAAGTAQTQYELIDDLEDNDERILQTMGRQGPWHIFNDQENGGNQVPPFSSFAPQMSGAAGTQYAVHTSGEGYGFAGVGFDLNNPEATPESASSQAIDASGWDGIAFYAKGSANLRLELPTRNFVPQDRGGSCANDCWNVYGHRLSGPLSSDWQEYKVPFHGLQRELGGTDPAFDASQLMSISFKHEGNAPFDFWIDEVRFYKEAGGNDPGGGAEAGGDPNNASCSFGTPQTGTGSFTWYYFSQGSFQEGDGYRTACGYFGRGAQGSGMNDRVENIANEAYFAAIPSESPENFDTARYCGACAEVENGDNRVIVTIIDACPTDNANAPCAMNRAGHLDLSVPAFDALGFATGNPTNTSWRFVPCPIEGNLVVRIKPGNPNQVYIENIRLPIQTVDMNGQMATRLSYGAWQLPGDAAGQMLRLTDVAGRVVTIPVSGASAGENQMTSAQFPACTQD